MSHRNPPVNWKQNPGEVSRAQFPGIPCHKQNPGEVTAALLGLSVGKKRRAGPKAKAAPRKKRKA